MRTVSEWGGRGVSGEADVGLPGQGKIEGIQIQALEIGGMERAVAIVSGEKYPE